MATQLIKDARGCPPGKGTHRGYSANAQKPAGMIGNPPFIPTDEQREKVFELSQYINQKGIALILGVSQWTIARHFKEEFERGRAIGVAELGKDLLLEARTGNARARWQYLKTMGARFGYSYKVELSGPDGGPVQMVDVSHLMKEMSDDDLATTIPVFEAILAGIGADGIPRYDTVSTGSDEGGTEPEGFGEDEG